MSHVAKRGDASLVNININMTTYKPTTEEVELLEEQEAMGRESIEGCPEDEMWDFDPY